MPRASHRLLPVGAAVCAALLASLPAARAADDPQLEGIVVTGARQATAPYEAPTQGSLDAGQPQSIINQHYIENNLTPGANYTDIINIAPSVSDTTPNGQGNAESLNLSIRGFQDGQFNVTFDGIPWTDSNDFTHHSTSYFTANSVGNVVVDRGPGTAAQIGNATFGGTVALSSKDPLATHNVTPALTIGSYHTTDYSMQVDTGAMGASGSRALLDLTSLSTDGAMTNNGQQRKNAFFKFVQPVGADTTITAVAMYNTVHQNVSQFGTTQAQLNQFGPNYSMNDNPASDAFYGFNFDDIHTDFEYVGVKTAVQGWRIDNKVYTYAYYHKINETNDPSLATYGSYGAYTGLGAPTDPYVPGQGNFFDVTGQKGFNNYRSWGDVFRGERDLGPGTLRAGAWVDYQWNDRALWDVDWTQGGTILPLSGATANPNANGLDRVQHNTLTTLSPFIEYEFHPLEALTITPGVRYTSFKRTVDAAVNQGSLAPLNYSHTWSAAQPSIYGNYRIASNWSAYAQYARGFLAPNLNLVYYTNLTAANEFTPENTNNLQAGTTWKSDRLTLAADVYHIKFNNFVTAKKGKGAFLTALGGGSAVFKGEEFEGTFALGAGLSAYANWSHNSATYADGSPVLNAPDGTSALGLIYDSGPLYASFISKRVGGQVQAGNNPATATGNYDIGAYTVNNVAVVYTLRDPGAGAKAVHVRVGIDNLSDNRAQYFVYGSNLAGADEFMTLPGRAYSVTLSADF